MQRNHKGSTLVWAISIIMVLVVIVSASLSFAYINYNRSIEHRKEVQAELTAQSGIEAIVSYLESGNTNISSLVPTTTDAEVTITEISIPQTMGHIESIVIKRDSDTQITVTLVASYSDVKSEIQAIMQMSGSYWKILRYEGGTS